MGFGRLKRGLNDDLAKDRYGIAYIGSPVGANLPPECKLLEVFPHAGWPVSTPIRSRTCRAGNTRCMTRSSGYVDVDAQGAVDPKVREYLRFIVSREGQQCVQHDGKYLPLTAEVCREMQQRLK